VFATLATSFSNLATNIWYGWSDSSGSSWTFGSTPVFAGSANQVVWDYPSIGVDASGRIVIGAVEAVW
jgi:hypothetical protein